MDKRRCGGAVLITALWLLSLMSLMASALVFANRHTLKGMADITGGIQARYLSEGAIQLVYSNLIKSQESQRLLADGEILNLKLPGGSVQLQVTDEGGKVDLNGADAILLARLLYSINVDMTRADAIADAIVDYRDRDDLRHLNGAEDAEYEAAGLGWGPKNAQFSSIFELRKVLGMDDALFTALQPHVTIYTRQRGVNPMVASLTVLAAVSDDSLFSLENFVEQRRTNHSDGLPLPKPPSVDRRFLSMARGTVYKLSALGEMDNGKTSGLTTIIRLRRARQNAVIETLEWLPYVEGGLPDSNGKAYNQKGISRT